MTQDQQEHAQALARQFEARMLYKYTKGAAEHGGNLWEMNLKNLLENALDEAIDQVVYILTALEKVNDRGVEE